MVLCVLLTSFKPCLTFAVYAFDYVVYKIEQGVTLNSLLRVVQHNMLVKTPKFNVQTGDLQRGVMCAPNKV